jgi:hypothetical protein
MQQCGMVPESRNSVAEETAVARQRVGKNDLAAINTQATREELLGAVFHMKSVSPNSGYVVKGKQAINFPISSTKLTMPHSLLILNFIPNSDM